MNTPDDETLALLRVRIAKLVGWTINPIEFAGVPDVAILPPGVSINDDGAVWRYAGIKVPDYTASLDAIAGAVASGIHGNGSTEYEFLSWLSELATGSDICDRSGEWIEEFRVAVAPAWMRAVAMDRTLSKEPIA